MFKILATTLALSLASLLPAAAATVDITGDVLQDPPAVNNNFRGALGTALGNDAQLLAPATITLPWAMRLTFTLVAAESGYANTFTATPTGGMTGTITEGANNNQTCKNASNSLLNCTLLGKSFSRIFGAGSLTGQLFFNNGQSGGNALNVSLDNPAFGVFTQGGAGNHSVFFLAFDDQNKNPDDNHDDMILRVNVSSVPLPAGGLLLIGAIGGLAALRRYKARAA